MHHPLAVLQCCRQRLTQGRFVGRRDVNVGYRQLNRVFLEAVDTGEIRGRQKLAVDPQV